MAASIAVIEGSGNLGREVLSALSERGVPASQVVSLATAKTMGASLPYGDDTEVSQRSVLGYDFSTTPWVIVTGASEASKPWVAQALKAGSRVIDATAANRLEPGVALMIPALNGTATRAQALKKRLVAAPGPAALALAHVLWPIVQSLPLTRAVITSLHSASGIGREAMDELFSQTKGIYVNETPIGSHRQFPKQIAFNVIPQVDGFASDGATQEEAAIAQELVKILHSEARVHVNSAYTAAFVGVSGFVGLEFSKAMTVEAVRTILAAHPALTIVDKRTDGGYVTPVEAVGEGAVFISRLRPDRSHPHAVSLWWTADNLKTAALNVVDIYASLKGDGS